MNCTAACNITIAIIIVVGIMNALWMAIRERTSEIGTLRAIGMSKSKVLLMFLAEAVLLSIIASTTGALLGTGVTALINGAEIEITSQAVQYFLMSDTVLLELHTQTIVTAICIITFFNGFGALYPAWRAARVPPVVAMRA